MSQYCRISEQEEKSITFWWLLLVGDGTFFNVINTNIANMISSKEETVILCDDQFCDLLLVSRLKNIQSVNSYISYWLMRTFKVKKYDDTYRLERCKKFSSIQHVPEMNIAYSISKLLINIDAINIVLFSLMVNKITKIIHVNSLCITY